MNQFLKCIVLAVNLVTANSCPVWCSCTFRLDPRQQTYNNIWHCGHQGISNDKLSFITNGQNLSDVNTLFLDGNHLNNLNTTMLKGFTQLKKLSLIASEISSFPSSLCTNLPSLETIILANNSIDAVTSISFTQCEGLKVLDLSRNRIHLLNHSSFSDLSELRQLDLSHNCIAQLFVNNFDGLQSLNKFDLSFNKIKKLPDHAFNGIRNVLSMDLSSNDLVYLSRGDFETLTNLNFVNLSRNAISQIGDGVFKSPDLEILDLSFNKLVQIKFESFGDARINTLALNGNPMICDCSLKSLIVFPSPNNTRKMPIALRVNGACSIGKPFSDFVSIQNLTSTLSCHFQCSGNQTCQNDGVCLMKKSATHNFFLYQCQCKDGYSGMLCRDKIKRRSESKSTVLIIMIVGIPVVILLVGLFIFCHRCRKKQQQKSDMYPLTDEDFTL